MSIELKINADTPEELIATINGLATLGRAPVTVSRAAPAAEPHDAVEERAETALEEASRPTSRRGRPAKAQAAAPQDTPPSEAEPASEAAAGDGSGSTAGTDATSVKSDLVGDKLSQQIKEAVAESPPEAEAPATITLEHLNEKFAGLIGDGKKFPAMRLAQEFLKANFVSNAKEPCRSLREVLPQDYPRLWQMLSE